MRILVVKPAGELRPFYDWLLATWPGSTELVPIREIYRHAESISVWTIGGTHLTLPNEQLVVVSEAAW